MNKMETLKKLAEPLKEWLASNYDPMCKIEISTDNVALLITEINVPLDIDD